MCLRVEREAKVSAEARMLARDRAELDRIDLELAKLVQARGEVVRRIQDARADGGRDWPRELEVLAAVSDVTGPYPRQCMRQLWSVLMFWAPETRT